VPGDDEPFHARVKRLASEQGLSVSKVGYLAYDPDIKGTNPDTFKSVMAGRRRVTIPLIEAVAGALGVPANVFPEYRLAQARRRLDEREVGLEEAVAMLEAVEQALMYPQGAELLESLEADRIAANAQPHPASPRGRRKTPAS